MNAILLAVLFAVSGAFAVAVIAQSWRRYGGAALALRGELRDCSAWREARVTVRTVRVHPGGSAVILRPDFRGRERSPRPAPALPAAA
jgi:hypothetical protein